MSSSIVKCPFCRNWVNENLLILHIKKSHKSGDPLVFIVESAGQELVCASTNNNTAYMCPFASIHKCKFSAGPLKIWSHIQNEHWILPSHYRNLGFLAYPSNFLERRPGPANVSPILLPGVPSNANLLDAPPSTPEPTSTPESANRPPNSIVVDLNALPDHFDNYVRARCPGAPVTSSDVVEFMRSLQPKEDASVYGPTPPPSYKAASSSHLPNSMPVPTASSSSHGRHAPYPIPEAPLSPTRAAGPIRTPRRPMVQPQSSTKYASPQKSSLDHFMPPASPVPLSIYDPEQALDSEECYMMPKGYVHYRKTKAANWVNFARLPQDKVNAFEFDGVKGPKAVYRRAAHLHDDITGVCIYHTVLNITEDCQTDTYHCSGPLGGKDNDYYNKFRSVIAIPSDICYTCWCPADAIAKPFYKHPERGRDIVCRDRSEYEDFYRGLMYIFLRCSVLRNAVFTWLGAAPQFSSRFQSTTDWARWLMLQTSRSFSKLPNYLTLAWAYLEMYNEGSLPKEELEFDDIECDPPLFSVEQVPEKNKPVKIRRG